MPQITGRIGNCATNAPQALKRLTTEHAYSEVCISSMLHLPTMAGCEYRCQNIATDLRRNKSIWAATSFSTRCYRVTDPWRARVATTHVMVSPMEGRPVWAVEEALPPTEFVLAERC